MSKPDLTREPPLWLHIAFFGAIFGLAVAGAFLGETLQQHSAHQVVQRQK
jgi:hypothetical protein